MRDSKGTCFGFLLICFGGCRAPGPIGPPGDILPKADAIALVNNNIERIDGTLRATGSVSGKVRLETGRTASYHLDGVLFYLPPLNVRFDLKRLGDRYVLLGSNQQGYWCYTKEQDKFICGPHSEPSRLPEDFPLRADQIIAALGISPISKGASEIAPSWQRVDDGYQKLLFLESNQQRREYWLDRRGPRLVRRVVFRNASGIEELSSSLDDYRPVAGGAYLPHKMSASWPQRRATMRFQINRWEQHPEITGDAPQFATPPECR